MIETFEEAIICLKEGKKVRRLRWNKETELFIYLVKGKFNFIDKDYVPENTLIEVIPATFLIDSDEEGEFSLPRIDMQTHHGIMIGWIPSAYDIFAEDWCIVE